ncbi:MAG: C1 family peptidase, partial [Anaerovibrio sp.]|nr:C1 family peptidase [Anaerovibrio sp.]
MSILSKSKKIILLLAASLCSVSLAGAEPLIDSETAAAPYYNLSLSVPTDRNSGYDPTRAMVNGVQNQGIYGTCWAFAAVAAAESSVYKQLQQEGIPYNVETNPVKYSPWYLAWIKSALPTEV